ncbi:hypothetical protein PUNSTDRAFT_130417 [Punctularia strigosozonata HHB-11173 SS5]|uniref:uncharacterized protein n=1 Tax=Punctularia strigosozonata (strain HHB-11173) TaxID=741275 RepID=UPI00044181BF|nr:uncharacterized protein PUNSTDRAFT_130417 [Punctularia strigosozonata HHB-11173 SS5]EIN12150.1 hypothetical protein PUNSTDRAFT_130417 [Punctularia strigosozonata HHB-11173 SS5]
MARGAVVVAGYKLSYDQAEIWAKKRGWPTDDPADLYDEMERAWPKEKLARSARIMSTEWPRALIRRVDDCIELARAGEPIILFGRRSQRDPKATSSTCIWIPERPTDLQFKSEFEQETGTKLEWVVVPDARLLIPWDDVDKVSPHPYRYE